MLFVPQGAALDDACTVKPGGATRQPVFAFTRQAASGDATALAPCASRTTRSLLPLMKWILFARAAGVQRSGVSADRSSAWSRKVRERPTTSPLQVCVGHDHSHQPCHGTVRMNVRRADMAVRPSNAPSIRLARRMTIQSDPNTVPESLALPPSVTVPATT